ncbi:odorant receptor 131-2-like [Megalops cyprinoides]|uniref:odorant receptor 131-2-like n=1 Tax=Megalops cyprinoides TaxID=118141 RepID=UPI0018642CB3|nr:odorant receptor 131-2-like [Megalops cyprinoides]
MNLNSSGEQLLMRSSKQFIVTLRMAVVQMVVWVFLYMNSLMLFTFFSKQTFWGSTRYILFALTLMMDSTFLLLSGLVVLQSYFNVQIPVASCIPICIVMEVVTKNSRVIIAAMCVERYVAICMPLRHAEMSTIGKTMAAIALISAVGSLKSFVDLFILVAVAPPGYFALNVLCFYDIMLLTKWHRYMRSAIIQVDFAVFVVIIVFCYVKIMLAAKAASGDNKESASKGRRTLLLHSLQLFLSMIEMWCPYVEAVFLEYDLEVFFTVRFFNFVAFTIISRALSSLIYGLRDQKFFTALVFYAGCKQNRISLEI